MELETKVLSRELQQRMYDNGLTIATAESCTGGRVAQAVIATPGASKYFKGGVICYSNDVKENLLGVSSEVLAEKSAVSEEVAIQMVKGACETLKADYAMAVTGYAGPVAGDNDGVPVGTIWLACGTKDKTITLKLNEDYGRDINLAIATNRSLRQMLNFIDAEKATTED